jgi:hypothetical protein
MPVAAVFENLEDGITRWRMVQRIIRKIVAAVDAAEPGVYVVVEIPVR